jgi:hypothetical protein
LFYNLSRRKTFYGIEIWGLNYKLVTTVFNFLPM